MSGPDVWCSRNHHVVSFESEDCEGGHTHLIYTCRMRVGKNPHGELAAVIPPFSDACTRTEDDEE
jgi:hypothetical protein